MTALSLPPRALARAAAATLLWVLAPCAGAQTPAPTGTPPALPQAAPTAPPPQVPDTMAQRLLACTACHGPEGRASREGYLPRIAGKPAGYLYQQLQHFRDGRRRGGRMTTMLEHLGDDYLREIAEHFAALDLPYPPAPAPTGTPAQRERGRQLALQGDAGRRLPACSACHGSALMGTQPATPGLLGLPRDYLVAQIGRWQVGVRRAGEPDCMAEIARRLTPEDLGALASWLAAQPVPAGARPAAAPEAPPPLRCGATAQVPR